MTSASSGLELPRPDDRPVLCRGAHRRPVEGREECVGGLGPGELQEEIEVGHDEIAEGDKLAGDDRPRVLGRRPRSPASARRCARSTARMPPPCPSRRRSDGRPAGSRCRRWATSSPRGGPRRGRGPPRRPARGRARPAARSPRKPSRPSTAARRSGPSPGSPTGDRSHRLAAARRCRCSRGSPCPTCRPLSTPEGLTASTGSALPAGPGPTRAEQHEQVAKASRHVGRVPGHPV